MECVECGRVFNLKQNFTKHLRSCQVLKMKKFRPGPPYECAHCGKSYDLRQNLVRHMHLHLPLESEFYQCFLTSRYECAVCNKIYNRRHNLVRHIRLNGCFLPSTGSINLIKKNHCSECQKTCRSSNALKQHMRSVHKKASIIPAINDHLKCVLCRKDFGRTEDVLHHIIDGHNVSLLHDHLRFSSMEEFQTWKMDTQKTTTSVFVKMRCHRGDDTNVTWYKCHRSGSYKPRVENRHRRVKLQGSMKIGGYCPATITVFEDKRTGRCKVSYVRTHLGHNICDEAELAHMYLSGEEKNKLADKIVMGVPYNRILTDNVDVVNEDPSIDPLYLLNKQSLFNISATYRIKPPPEAPTVLEPYSVETFVAGYHQSILFLKRAGETHPTESALDVGDAMVIVMLPVQEEMLRKFGNHIVTADGTFGYNEHGFVLHSFGIIDEWYEGVPVALAISNRNDRTFTNLFARTVRQKVGHQLRPKTFMSEMGTTYYNSWSQVMGPVRFQLFCKWHVDCVWRHKARKIEKVDKRVELLKRLQTLSMCLDENQFLVDLEELIADPDPEMQPFLLDLAANYVENAKSWAYCYRVNAGINVNVHLKTFDRCLKYFNGNFLKSAKFTDFLSLLNDFLELETKDLTRKRIFGKRSLKLSNLRKRHDEVVKRGLTMTVDDLDDPFVGWLVSVCERDDDSWSMYAIRPKKAECVGCKMYCEVCRSCLHNYECTCRDYCIEFNMCVHIHKLCLYLKESSQSKEDDAQDDSQPVGVDFKDESEESNLIALHEDLPPNSVTCDSKLSFEDEVIIEDENEFKFAVCNVPSESSNVTENDVKPMQMSFIELCKQIKNVDGVEVLKRIVRITDAELNAVNVNQ